MTSLSNMPRIRTEHREENWEADIFEKSMRMSTYLVAFVFSDYVGKTKGKVTVWAPQHRIEDADYALKISEKVLEYYERMLEIPYPGFKLDLVPVTYLEAEAMENWGLIIFEQTALLTPEDKKNMNSEVLNEIASTVAHEIAHQWFGNLVTIKWWSDIWLNEGITSYMQDIAISDLLPEWNEVDPTISSAYGTLTIDCSESDPIWQPVRDSLEAEISFYGVTYPKGSMVTRMAHQILGNEAFWKGIRRYLNSNAYGNVEEADLWRYLTAAQKPGAERLDMAEIMYSWTHLSGIPIVTVLRDYSRRTAIISQKSCKSNDKKHENDLWNIPIIIENKYAVNLLNKITWLKKKNTTVEGMPHEDEWIVVNGDSAGYYIVNYDKQNWNLLFNQLRINHQLFDYTQRFKFLVELTTLERSGEIEIDLVLQHFIYLKKERDIEMFWTSFQFMHNYVKFFDEEKYHELLKEFLVYIWKDMYDSYGWIEREDHSTLIISSKVTNSHELTKNLCYMGYEPCMEEALVRYLILKQEETTVNDDSNNNWLALCTAVRNATYEEWNEIKETHFDKHGRNLSFALKCSNNPSVIRGELLPLLENNYRGLDWFIIAASKYKATFDEVISFFDENFEKLTRKGIVAGEWEKRKISNGVNPSRIQQIIQMLTKHLKNLSGTNAKSLKSLLDFIKKKLPELEKKTRTLKEWLEEKRWLRLI